MSDAAPPPARPKGPLDALERRILGALIEKAKTTPDAYPLSLNALRTACNQKNNRAPQMELTDDRVETAAETLREKGALSIVQGDSRVERYRHRAYEWLGVEKVELAVVAELLLRGAQTVGELRGRAARMEPIKGLAELEPVLESLERKGLIAYLSPPGRGAVVTHTFYAPQELDKVRRELGLGPTALGSSVGVGAGDTVLPARLAPTGPHPAATTPSAIPPTALAGPTTAPPRPEAPRVESPSADALAALREELLGEIHRLRDDLAELRAQLGA